MARLKRHKINSVFSGNTLVETLVAFVIIMLAFLLFAGFLNSSNSSTNTLQNTKLLYTFPNKISPPDNQIRYATDYRNNNTYITVYKGAGKTRLLEYVILTPQIDTISLCY